MVVEPAVRSALEVVGLMVVGSLPYGLVAVTAALAPVTATVCPVADVPVRLASINGRTPPGTLAPTEIARFATAPSPIVLVLKPSIRTRWPPATALVLTLLPAAAAAAP